MKVTFENISMSILMKSLPRYVTLIAGVLIYFLMFRVFSPSFFSHIVVSYGTASVLLWVADFGSNNLMLLHHKDENFNLIKNEWTKKLVRTLILGLISLIFSIFYDNKLEIGVLIIVCLLDLDSDTSVGLRQFIYTTRKAATLQIMKKVFQVFILLLWVLLDWGDNIVLFAILFLFPVITLKLIDTARLGGFTFQKENGSTKKSFSMWVQGGYPALSNLDLIILSFFGNEELVVTLALAKKIVSALFILGSTLSTDTIGSRKPVITSIENGKQSNEVRQTFFLSLVTSILFIAFLNPLLSLMGKNRSESFANSVLITIALTVPITVLSSYYNSRLINIRQIFLAGIQGYSSVIIYLSVLTLSGFLNNLIVGLLLALTLRATSELCVGIYFFTRTITKNVE